MDTIEGIPSIRSGRKGKMCALADVSLRFTALHCASPTTTLSPKTLFTIPPALSSHQPIRSLQLNYNLNISHIEKVMGNVLSGHAWYHQVINPYTTLGNFGNLPLKVRDLVYELVLTNTKYIDRCIDVDDYRRWTPMFISQYFLVAFRSSAALSAETILVALRINILVLRTHFSNQALTEFLDCTLEKKGWASVREVHVPRFSGFNEYKPAAAFKLVKRLAGLKRLTLTFNAEKLRLVENQTAPNQYDVTREAFLAGTLVPKSLRIRRPIKN
jgi:hypothetical protein